MTRPDLLSGAIGRPWLPGGLAEPAKPTARPPGVRRAVALLSLVLAFALGFAAGAAVPPLDRLFGDRTSATNDTPAEAEVEAEVEDEGRTLRERSPDGAGVFWSERVERALPAGFGDEDDRSWAELVRTSAVAGLEPGCGRMQNRLLTFADGTAACARYRQNTDQIQGEMFSYHLGRMLGLRNLAPSAVALVNGSSAQWAAVRAALDDARWRDGRPVVLTRFIRDLEPAPIPASLRRYTRDTLGDDLASALSRQSHTDLDGLSDLADGVRTVREAVEMAQWSDLIVFDYLTANLDRVVNNLYNLQWNPNMMSSPAHNLARTRARSLVFLDNESGLLHGYRLLDKYDAYHRLLLGGLCVFRRSTVRALAAMGRAGTGPAFLLARRAAADGSPLPGLPDANAATLDRRVAAVLRRAASCARRSPAPLRAPTPLRADAP